jgi:hypothetical protein
MTLKAGTVLRFAAALALALTVAAALALALTVTGTTVAASAPADPVSRVSWSSGTGTVLCLGLGAPHKPPHAGEPAVLAGCRIRPDQSWDFTGNVLRPYGSSLSVTVAPSGRLVLATGTGAVWTYGPGHELSVATPSGPSYLAYCGTGRYPVVGAPCGTLWYVFTQAQRR